MRGWSRGDALAPDPVEHHFAVRIRAKGIISAISRVFGIAAVDAAVIREALELRCPDFEDAVTAAAAHLAHCDYIVTRDVKGFNGSLVSSFTPEGILPLLV
jgi:PIN domain